MLACTLLQVRLVKRKIDGKVYAMKTMIKETMVMKNQVSHVRAERDVMAKAKSSNRWLTKLLFSFQVVPATTFCPTRLL